MSLSIADLEALMQLAKEHEHVEFKEAKQSYDTTKLMRYCVGIANEGGGHFILGITDARPRRVVGTAAYPDGQDIASKIFAKLRFRVSVEQLDHPSGRCLSSLFPHGRAVARTHTKERI